MNRSILLISAFLFSSLGPPTSQPKDGPPQDVSYCQLVKDPSAFSGRRIRVRAIYSYMFEVSRLKPPKCCPNPDAAIWVKFDDDLDGSSTRKLHSFPEGMGLVLATFLGNFEKGGPYGAGGYRFKLAVDGIEKVEAMAKPSLRRNPAWAPNDCDTPNALSEPPSHR